MKGQSARSGSILTPDQKKKLAEIKEDHEEQSASRQFTGEQSGEGRGAAFPVFIALLVPLAGPSILRHPPSSPLRL